MSDPAGIPELQDAIRHRHGGEATQVTTVANFHILFSQCLFGTTARRYPPVRRRTQPPCGAPSSRGGPSGVLEVPNGNGRGVVVREPEGGIGVSLQPHLP